MELFDKFRRLENSVFYLCNPDKSFLGALTVRNASATVRFNDLSELSFEVPKFVEDLNGEQIISPSYFDIATKRLVYIDNLGWFKITQAVTKDDGTAECKAVTAESHQATFKDVGFVKEERVYKFYDETDPTDSKYVSSKKASIPSVVGQLYRQLGIVADLKEKDFVPTSDYEDWTIIYIPSELFYAGNDNDICRTFKESDTTFGYDFMVSDVEEAFEVIFEFDFLHHAIKIKTVEEATRQAPIWLSFDNLIKSTEVTESAEDIVTVLNCSGTDIDIRKVNPSGTNYLVNFDYYMSSDGKWMSKGLINAITSWKEKVKASESAYEEKIVKLREKYLEKEQLNEKTQYIAAKLRDLESLRDSIASGDISTDSDFAAETVEVGENSVLSGSAYADGKKTFSGTDSASCFNQAPTFGMYSYIKQGKTKTATFDDAANAQDPYLYFFDNGSSLFQTTYCMIQQGEKPAESGTGTVSYAKGFIRYARTSNLSTWLVLYTKLAKTHARKISAKQKEIDAIETQLAEMNDELNLLSYLSKQADGAKLLREIRCYWIEGDYENENIASLENTTLSEEIKLAKELKAAGELELSRVSAPRFSFSLDVINFFALYEYKKFTEELNIGETIIVEKRDGECYNPCLTSITFGFEETSELSLEFSTDLKIKDWGFSFADMVTSSASTARSVSSNWMQLTSYSKEKTTVNNVLMNPLDRSLKDAQTQVEQATQEFIVDNTGILGRKASSSGDGSFDGEQLRLFNNMILFTDNGWRTCKTALGKVSYTDGDETKTAYGLLAEVVVGDLMIGKTLKLSNASNTIIIDEDGFAISKKNEDGTLDKVFHAKTDGDVFIKGRVEASAGSVGNCKIEDGAIVSQNGNFKIDADGNAYLNGEIKATSGSIGNCKIDSGAIVSGNGNFKIDAAGNVFILGEGNISLGKDGGSLVTISNEGSIKFLDSKTDNNPTEFTKASLSLTRTDGNIFLGFEKTQGSGADVWVNYLKMDPSMKILAKNGSNGKEALLAMESSQETSRVDLTSEVMYLTAGSMTLSATTNGKLSGQWTTSDGIAITSDKNAKSGIEALPDNYSNLFDGLRPVRFKYVDGRSGRYHTGFIAQDVKDAIDAAGLSSLDFAAYVESSGLCYLRYEEIIALCVDEIQKLKMELKELKGDEK